MLRDLHSQKYDLLPPDVMAAVIEDAGSPVHATLMFLLGSSIDRDPLHPWARIADARALHSRALAELDRFMKLDRLVREN